MGLMPVEKFLQNGFQLVFLLDAAEVLQFHEMIERDLFQFHLQDTGASGDGESTDRIRMSIEQFSHHFPFHVHQFHVDLLGLSPVLIPQA
jgi:hypothetical protein